LHRYLIKSGETLSKNFKIIKVFLKQLYDELRRKYLKKKYPNGTFLLCNGAHVFCDFSSKNYSWYDGNSRYLEYELEVFTSLFNIRSPDVIVDVGSHWGFYSAFLDKSVFHDKISKLISIEADPINSGIQEKTLSKLENLNVEQIKAAVSDENGYISLYEDGGTCLHTYPSPGSVLNGRVQAISFDTLIEQLLMNGEALTHIKMDIDGYEPALFAGGKYALKRYKPIIMMEFWAKGLKKCEWNLNEYWNMLQNNYFVQEANFSTRSLNLLKQRDLSYLIKKTNNGITNLVLIPK